MLLPGPEAQQLAIYIGSLLHRTAGGIVAGALVVIPSMFILWALSAVDVLYGNVPWIAAIFYGLKPAVMAIVIVAVIRIRRKRSRTPLMWSIAAIASGSSSVHLTWRDCAGIADSAPPSRQSPPRSSE